MKKIFLILLLNGCALMSAPTDKEIDLFCQDLNVLYQRLSVIAANSVNVNTTRTAEGGPYVRKKVVGCRDGFCEIINDDSPFVKKYEPNSPDADETGYVAYPNVSLEAENFDKLYWEKVYATVIQNAPVPPNFFFTDPRAKTCFEKYPTLNAKRNFFEYLGRE